MADDRTHDEAQPEGLSKSGLLRQLAEARAIAAEQMAGRETRRAAQLDLCLLQTQHELHLQLQTAHNDLNLARVEAHSYKQQFEQVNGQLERITRSLPWKLLWPLRIVMRQVRALREGGRPAVAASPAHRQTTASGPMGVPEVPSENLSVPETSTLPDRPAVLLVLHDDPNEDTVFDGVDLCRMLSESYAVYVWLLTPARQTEALAQMAHTVRLRPAGYDDSTQAIEEVCAGVSFEFVIACGLETRPVLPALQAGRWPVVGIVPDTGRRPVSPTVLHAFALGTHATAFADQSLLRQARDVTFRMPALQLVHWPWSPTWLPSADSRPDQAGEVDVVQIMALAEQARAMTAQESHDVEQILSSTQFVAHYVDPACPASVSREAVVGTYLRNWRTGYYPRKPAPGFHPDIYREHHPALPAYADPFADYVRQGAPQGPWNAPVIDALAPQPAALASGVRTALHIHAYYPDLVPEMLERLAFNATKPTVYVTVKSADDEARVREMLQHYPGGPHIVMQVPNSGRDIGPFLSGVGAQLCDQYDIIGHIHTKRSPHISDTAMVDRWRHFLLENLLGGTQSGAMADAIFAAMQADPSLGIVFPDDPSVCGWDQNETAARLLAPLLGVGTLPKAFNFPVGTMFWIRPDLLRRFVNLNLTWADYPLEPLGADGSMLHAIERLLGVVPAALGKRSAVTWVDGVTR